jgi:hypothetical protein
MIPDPMTAAGFMTERADFLFVYHTPSPRGNGWDIVLRIDGTYFDEHQAIEAAEGMRRWIDALDDVPNDGRDWSGGPPEWHR